MDPETMAVEARVNVQAMKGKFEQLYDDPPLVTPSLRSTLAPTTTTTTRPRAVSLSKTEAPRFAHTRQIGTKLISPGVVSKVNKSGAFRVRGYSTGETPPPSALFNTPAKISASTPRKHSSNLSNTFETRIPDASLHDETNHHLEQSTTTTASDTKSSVVRRIPVFKSNDSRVNSESKNIDKNIEDEPVDEPHGIRGKLFTHIRSRSHGNFNIKRDPSTERNYQGRDKNNAVHKENKFHREWLTPKRKQRSTDNLLCNQDSNSSSTFEGKQKLVANVVKNMKNKDKPTVLRKLSFSSKIEKELKNMKEKSSSHESKASKPGKLRFTQNNTTKTKHKADGKTLDDSDKALDRKKQLIHFTSPESPTSPVALARAVADVALRKSGMVSAEMNESSSSCEDNLTVPPSRPPRRRSGSHNSNPSTTPHKKGKAPAPPGASSVSPTIDRHTTNDEAFDNYLSDEDRHITGTNGLDTDHDFSSSPRGPVISNEYPGVYYSTESLLSSNSTEKSREDSPVMMTHGNSLSFSDIASGAHIRSSKRSPQYASKDHHVFKYDVNSIHVGNTDLRSHDVDPESPKGYDDDASQIQGLPVGPPPKKPPRTFAYDIYKNVIPSKHDEPITKTEAVKENGEAEKCTPPPIYAVPVKKKSKGSSNNFIPKPPIRSKSDLSSKDIAKPPVATKPPHVLAKAKRASLVDPVSSYEKEDDTDMAMEFQRQAHVRYSLRRPKKPPPTPPPYKETNGIDGSPGIANNTNDSRHCKDEYCNENGEKSQNIERHNIDYRTSKSPQSRRRPHSNSFLQSSSISGNDYEDVVFGTSPGNSFFSGNNLQQSSSPMLDSEQPMSLGFCSPSSLPSDTTGLFNKRSMSDETLYKGSRRCDEPVYATPVFHNSSDSSDHSGHAELHYMAGECGGRDGCIALDGRGRRTSKDKIMGSEAGDCSKGRSGIISAWKREFRQSCRQVQNKIKKTVIR